MARTYTDRTVFDAALKDLYLEPIREIINRATVLLMHVKKKKNVQVSGKQYIIPLITQRHAGIVTRSGATKLANRLPTAHAQKYDRATYNIKYHYGRIEVDGPSMRASKNNQGAFINSLDAEIKGLTNSLPQEFNRQLHGDGTNLLAQPTVSGSSTNVMVVSSTKFLHPDQKITILANADGTVVAGGSTNDLRVSSITNATTIVLSAATSWTHTTDGVYPESYDTTATSYGGAMNGLANLINTTGTVGGINRATAGNEFWKANILANGGTARAVTMGLLQQAILTAETARYGGKRPTMAICDADMWATVGNLWVVDKRFRGEAMTLDGGFQALSISGVPLVFDKDATAGEINFWNDEHFFFLSQTEPQWMEEDGAILNRVTDYDSYEAVLVCDKEWATDLPSCGVRLDDLDTNLT
jgi:hypothetical protein